uniref:Uncharacterized protein n=1 Tax=Musa acuminata subsp. malaccensis TaxID=214687 RepID=A0A804KTX0_MUSAM
MILDQSGSPHLSPKHVSDCYKGMGDNLLD